MSAMLISPRRKFRLDAPIQHMRYIEWLERNHLLENQQPNGTTDEANGVPKPEGWSSPIPHDGFY